jgi:diguanylate cyclase (GGDEF)-like protein
MAQPPPRRRRARPVADAPLDELLTRTDALAKGWLLALLEVSELDEAPAILAGGIASDGPRICAAALRAVADDRDLARLEPGGLLEPLAGQAATFAGPAGPEAALRAVEALHAVLWSGLRSELRDPEPELVLELAERLNAVVERVRGAAVRAAAPVLAAPAVAGAAPEVRHGLRAVPVEAQPAQPPAPGPPSESASPAGRDRALWVAALEDEVGHAQRAGAPLALLLVELEDGDRLASAEAGREAGAAFGRFAQAVRSVLRRPDLLASEAGDRVWVIARDTARPGATALAERIAAAVRASDPVHGAPLRASVGVAVLGEDAHQVEALLEAAEEAALAAAAGGDEVGERVPDAPETTT